MTRCKNPAHWDEPQDACPLCDGDTRAAAKVWTAVEIADQFQQWKRIPQRYVTLEDHEHTLQQARAAAEQIVNTWQKGSLAHAVRVDWGQLIADVEHTLQQARQPLRWTTRKPKEAGWYWFKYLSQQYIVHIYDSKHGLRVETPAGLFTIDELSDEWGGEFAGPIAPPERGEE